ncbi:hypothetical protein DPMN_146796 [Dreissena polymorpha]|uniref:Uncharacterized protein n=1 Tax=Dreissena polymorpha TaxID=45954 RepID=A0A9D4F8K5_DREPO|nr:hypothetical protein DPMN_146796 [Dreissena polymorpha]
MHRNDRKSVNKIGCSFHDEEHSHLAEAHSSTPDVIYIREPPRPAARSLARVHMQVERARKGFYHTRGT